MAHKDFDEFWSGVEKDSHTFTAYGEEFEIPPTMPAKVILEIYRFEKKNGQDAEIPDGKALELGMDILGEDQLERLADAGAGVDEIIDIITWSQEIYSGNEPSLGDVEEDENGEGSGN